MKKNYLLLICLGLTTTFILQGSVFGAILPSLVDDFQVGWGLLGILMSLWTVSSAASPLLVGKYIHDLKPLNAVVLVMTVLSLSTLMTAFVENFTIFNMVRFIGSIAVPFPFPLAAKLVTTYIVSEKRGIATAVYGTGSILGLALGYVVVAAVRGSWRHAMIIAGFVGIAYIPVACVLWKGFLRLTDSANTKMDSFLENQTTFNLSASDVYKIVRWLSLGHFAAVYTWNLMFTWLSTFLVRELGVGYGAIALSLSIMAVFAAVMEVFVGIWSDKLIGTKKVIPLYIGLVPCSILLAVAVISSNGLNTAILMSLAILFWRLSTPSFWILFSDLVPRAHFEKASGVYVMAVLLSGIVSSTVNGFLVSAIGSMKYSMALTAIVLVFSPIFYTVAAFFGYRLRKL